MMTSMSYAPYSHRNFTSGRPAMSDFFVRNHHIFVLYDVTFAR